MKTVEFFYDITCPYAYLASTQVDIVAARANAEVIYKPFLLGGLLRDIGQPTALLDHMTPERARMGNLDLHRWAENWNVPLRFPAEHPKRSVLGLRAALVSPDLRRASFALYKAYWVDELDIANPQVLKSIFDEAGFAGAELLKAAEAPEVKADLRKRTNEAVERGCFGAPTFFVDGEMYWGQDRLDWVAEALGAPPVNTDVLKPLKPDGQKVEFWYDFSSPFAYLGSTQIEEVAKRCGATVEWKPFLLGALFKAIGSANVPLQSFPAPKMRYYMLELERFAERYGVPYSFSSHFPMKTVRPLRLALLAGDKIAPLTHAIFRAGWGEDRDISDSDVLKGICTEVGLPPSLVDETSGEDARAALKATTSQAHELGMCGAPSFVANDQVFWGQDRLQFVEQALRGWKPFG
jgi:2-hydroxychromene-2-carboxylate isomerase